ncbi:type I methionyl aminopeptidase [Alphaproteobacteria bacterium endosymbiont of Tiliacea citrago]|uniref:type I methionyl aminopeptidase n=1 Tax=Alphaproteobacteria bacterium endosymbiont of Tiliacea citrago TaxID=3077944 RepID=UPI00313B1049
MGIPIHNKSDFEKMRVIGRYTYQLLNELENIIKPGISTFDIELKAISFIEKYNLKSACLGYKGFGNIPFPANICTSVNHVICHGIPDKEHVLMEGDIVGVDVTIIKDGYFGDSCRTFAVGKISEKAKNLIETTKKAMDVGIQQAYHGNFLGNIGYEIQHFINSSPIKYSIVEDYCGHGIGTKFHQEPQIEHVGQKNSGIKMQQGMFFTVEPMINLGSKKTKLLKDNWTVITKDYSLSAQFEHTIAIGENGVEIFTKD